MHQPGSQEQPPCPGPAECGPLADLIQPFSCRPPGTSTTHILDDISTMFDALANQLDAMLDWVAAIELRSPQILKEYRAKVEDKVKELLEGSGIDENRIDAEVTLFADKICVDEETVRLTSHIRTMKDALLKGGAVGRKLDFIAQEMNREANTILSKANDLEISGTAIELKTEIEKVREQIQNIE